MKTPQANIRIMDCLYSIRQSKITGLFGYDEITGCFAPSVFKYKNKLIATKERNQDPNVWWKVNQVLTTGIVYSVPQIEDLNGASFLDIAKVSRAREIRFEPGELYAVVHAGCYMENKGYTTHKTEASAIKSSKRDLAFDYIHHIIDRYGIRYKTVIDDGEERLSPIPDKEPSESFRIYVEQISCAKLKNKEQARTGERVTVEGIAYEVVSIMASYAHKTVEEFVSDLIFAESERQIKEGDE